MWIKHVYFHLLWELHIVFVYFVPIPNLIGGEGHTSVFYQFTHNKQGLFHVPV